jgi:hypothetical protein
MTLAEFNAMPYEQQLAVAYNIGTYLASRLERDYVAVNLHYLGSGLYAEFYYNALLNQVVLVRGFTDQKPLANYAISVKLPEAQEEST